MSSPSISTSTKQSTKHLSVNNLAPFRLQSRLLNRCLTALLGFCLGLPLLALAQPWASLTPPQQEAMAPLSKEWNTLPTKQQQHFLALAKRYPRLTPVEKNRLHDRLEHWSKLTPAQRKEAREKYRAFNKVPPESREQVKEMVRQQEAGKLASPASAVLPATPVR